MEIGNFTRGEVKDFIEKRVKNGLVSEIIGHRLILLFEQFPNIQSFLDASEPQLLQAYRKISKSKKDLGKRTYNEHQAIKSHFKKIGPSNFGALNTVIIKFSPTFGLILTS